jgi:hypothetical protein
MEGNKISLNEQSIVYSLNINDVQTVAMDTLHRNLTAAEIKSIEVSIANNIEWYEAIQQAIMNKLVIA